MNKSEKSKEKQKRKAIKDRVCDLEVFYPANLKGKSDVPIVIYMHNILNGHFSPEQLEKKEIKKSEIPGISILLERMKEMPFLLVVPICYDYQWALEFKSLVAQINLIRADKHTEPFYYVIGHGLGGTAAFRLAGFDSENIRGLITIDSGGLDEINISKLVPFKVDKSNQEKYKVSDAKDEKYVRPKYFENKQIHLYQSDDNFIVPREHAEFFHKRLRDAGNYMALLHVEQCGSDNILKEVLSKRNFLL